MSQAVADRNLLLGVIALQMDFINRDNLVSAMNMWALSKDQSLGMILLDMKALGTDSLTLLEALVDKHLALHDDDAEKSLASISSVGSFRREDLQKINDAGVQASLLHMAETGSDAADPFATVAPHGNVEAAASVPLSSNTPMPASNESADPFATVPPKSVTAADPYATAAPSGTVPDPFATAAPTAQSKSTKGPAPKPGYAAAPRGLGDVAALRFHILRHHAKGGLGAVFVAKDQELNREVALKEIQDRHADNLDSRSRFMLEAEITGGLEHPGIVPVYGLGTYADGRPYYAMRFIRGDSLKEAIDRFHKSEAGMDPGKRTLELRNLLGRFVDVCNAIAYAHSRNVLHRDLKPGNIMLGKYGETLVVDWGLAKPIGAPETEGSQPHEIGEGSLVISSLSGSSQTLVGAAVGTPQYMSPEQAAGKLDLLGPASDVYSLGATLFCLLTGRAPIVETDVNMVLQRVQAGDFVKPRAVKPSMSRPLEAICLKAMALDPKDRYATTRLLADDIEHWLADEPVSAWPEPWIVRVRRWINRHRTLVTSVVSAVLVAVIGLGVATGLLAAANERERKAKDLAQHNFNLARKAVDTYQRDVSESFLADEPGTEELRKKLLSSAQEFYAQFVEERKDDKEVRGEFGRALYRLAQINGTLGNESKAVDLYQQSIKVFNEMLAVKDDDDLKRDLARSYHHLGRVARIADQLPLSQESYKKADDLWKELVAKGNKEEDQLGRARTQIGLGNWYQRQREVDKAEKFYKDALAGWQKLADAHPNSEQYKREVANANSNLGQVRMYLGEEEVAQAKTDFEKAIAMQEKVVAAGDKKSDFKDDLARFTFNLGEWYQRAGKIDEAGAKYSEAAKLWEALVARSKLRTSFSRRLADAYNALARVSLSQATASVKKPAAKKALEEQAEKYAQNAVSVSAPLAAKFQSTADYSACLARNYVLLADVHRKRKEVDKADGDYQKALPVQEKLVLVKKGDPIYRSDLAKTWSNLGSFYGENLKIEKSTAAYEKAADMWAKLARDFPKDQEYPRNLAKIFNNLGNIAFREKKKEDALSWYGRSLDALEFKSDRNRPEADRVLLLNVLFTHAELATDLSKYPRALEDWDRGIALAAPKQKLRYEFPRAILLARMGKYADAIVEAERLEKLVPQDEAKYRLSWLWALAAGYAAKDTSHTAQEREALSEQYAARAVKLLSAARQNGFFKSDINVRRLHVAPELQLLRDRKDFKKLLGDL